MLYYLWAVHERYIELHRALEHNIVYTLFGRLLARASPHEIRRTAADRFIPLSMKHMPLDRQVGCRTFLDIQCCNEGQEHDRGPLCRKTAVECNEACGLCSRVEYKGFGYAYA